MSRPIIEGIIGYLVTPFAGAGLNLKVLHSLIDRMLAAKVNAIAPLGSTGEAAYLSEEEWIEVAGESCQHVAGQVPVIIGIAEVSTAAAVRHAIIAEQLGATAIMVLPVSYWKIDDAEIFHHFSIIADAISIPIMAYNNPTTSGTDMSPELICRMAREIDNVQMIKESSGDLSRMIEIQTISEGQLPFYNGSNPMAHAAFAAGASGWCTAAANLIPDLNIALYQKHQQGDLEQAQLIFQQQLPLLDFMMSKSLPATVKCGLDLLGVPAGAPRLPLFPLSPSQGEELSRILQRLGISIDAVEHQ